MSADAPYPGNRSRARFFHLFGLFTTKALFIQAGIVNGVFLAYYLLYALRVPTHDPLMVVLLHVCVLSIVFIIPGYVTTTLVSRSYWDIVHFAVSISMLSSASVLGLKLLLNAFYIPISAVTFSLAILVYSNLCLVCQRMIRAKREKERASAICARSRSLGSGKNVASRFTGSLVLVILAALFVSMEVISLRLGPIQDTDQASFGTYNIMTRSVPGAGYYEPERIKNLYENYTPFLKYDFSHPPLVPFSNAYVATLCGYLKHSKTIAQQWTENKYRPSYDMSGLTVDLGYLACNRASSHYHIVLLALLVYVFALRLTGRPVLALITMLCPIFLFSHLEAYGLSWLSIYKSVFVLYSLLMLYSFLYWKQDYKFAFMLGLYGSLVSQKAVYVIPAILAVDVITSRWRAVRNPYALGFVCGVMVFIVYGMLIDARVFISNYFVSHLADRIVPDPFTWVDQWGLFVGYIIGFWSFLVLACLGIVFVMRHYRSRTIVLFLYWLSAALCGTWMWPHVPRFLTPTVLPMVLMACCSVNDLLGKFTKQDREKGEDTPTPADESGFGIARS